MFELTTPFNFTNRNTYLSSDRCTTTRYWQNVVIFALALVTRIIGLTHQSLWYDEGYTYNLASAKTFSVFLNTFASYTTSEHLQPVYYFFVFFWSRLAGASDAALRMPSAIFSAASCVAVFDLSSRLTRTRGSMFPMFACAAVAASSFSVYYAQEARPYALLQALSLWFVNLWIRRNHLFSSAVSAKASGVAFGVLCALCVLGSAFTALLVFALALTDWIVARSKEAWLLSWGSPLTCSVFGTAAYFGFCIYSFPGFIARDVTSIKQPLWMNIGYTIYGILFGTTLGPSNSALRGSDKLHLVLTYWPLLVVSAIAVAALAVGIMSAVEAAGGAAAATRSTAIAAAIYTVIFFTIFGIAGHLNILPRHASALFALIVMLVLLCATEFEASDRAKTFAWLYLGISTWCAMNLASLYSYRFDPDFRKDDYRSVTELIASNESAPVFMIAGQPRLIEHYGASVIDASSIPPLELDRFLRERSRDSPEVWLIMNEYRGFRWDNSPGPAKVLTSDYTCLTGRHAAFMDVIVCRLKTPTLFSRELIPTYGTRSDGPVYAR